MIPLLRFRLKSGYSGIWTHISDTKNPFRSFSIRMGFFSKNY